MYNQMMHVTCKAGEGKDIGQKIIFLKWQHAEICLLLKAGAYGSLTIFWDLSMSKICPCLDEA